MSIFIAPDAEGTMTVWADVPDKDPVALLTEPDIRDAAVPLMTTAWDPRYLAAKGGADQVWRLILDNVPARADA